MRLSREEVLHIALLARVGVTDAEVDIFSEQLSNILENFEELQKIDTDAIKPTAQSIELSNVIGEDIIQPSLDSRDVLANAPEKEQDYFKIKAVLEEHGA
ncbi:MAG: Asp-tRNA(Asn)/Glu-tRNA(Gln) amidotransferase subunit GatC [Dehalococcoidales bacterium]|jgi:aspartyl-tRNA(Asn)/glutamyl-tRNA(Gln) amidotransferase subunit C|nr:Asp-tRNA(Asn)/Glu-tRNA(Gln) amidotransferase subunit GatC [Dehalococcoidales bacterium]